MITSQIAKRSETPEDLKRILDEAQKAGVDIEGLKHNLSLTPDQRLDQFLKALAWLEWAQQAQPAREAT